MNTLYKRAKWLTVGTAAKRLSTTLLEPVSAADIMQLVENDEINIYARFDGLTAIEEFIQLDHLQDGSAYALAYRRDSAWPVYPKEPKRLLKHDLNLATSRQYQIIKRFYLEPDPLFPEVGYGHIRIGALLEPIHIENEDLVILREDLEAFEASIEQDCGSSDAKDRDGAQVERNLKQDPRQATTDLNIIGALLGFITGELPGIEKHPNFKTQADLIDRLIEMNDGVRGISKRTLEGRFHKAKLSLERA